MTVNTIGKLRDAIFSPLGLLISAAVAFGTYYLWTNHSAHVLGALPYLPILACIAMHFFMHRGHGGSRDSHQDHRH